MSTHRHITNTGLPATQQHFALESILMMPFHRGAWWGFEVTVGVVYPVGVKCIETSVHHCSLQTFHLPKSSLFNVLFHLQEPNLWILREGNGKSVTAVLTVIVLLTEISFCLQQCPIVYLTAWVSIIFQKSLFSNVVMVPLSLNCWNLLLYFFLIKWVTLHTMDMPKFIYPQTFWNLG